jgi:hypothetical protein
MSPFRTRTLSACTAAVTTLLLVVGLSGPALAGGKATKKHSTHNSNSAFCQLYRSEAKSVSKITPELEGYLQANNWRAAKRLLLAEFAQESKLIAQFTNVLASTPANVRAAGRVALNAIPAEKKAVQTSNSVAHYEVAVEKTFNTSQLVAAGKVFRQYETTTCGATTPPA